MIERLTLSLFSGTSPRPPESESNKIQFYKGLWAQIVLLFQVSHVDSGSLFDNR